jgi:nitroimidazol reductase NimA-like FMN-containing flavoprotein (pyridoxamine 5'-phosphate oxidase superfamily)
MSLTMSQPEREAFLAATRIGIVSVEEPGRGPLTVPVWYHYAPGADLRFVTGRTSRKATLMRGARRISLCVQTETAPYSYVSVEGPFTLGAPEYERDVREMALRYLGPELGAAYLETMHPGGDVSEGVLVTLTPARWFSVDYSKMSLG